jgi:hypothetical protein
VTGWPEHAHRAGEHQQPRPTTHWGVSSTPHPGPVRENCEACKEEGPSVDATTPGWEDPR